MPKTPSQFMRHWPLSVYAALAAFGAPLEELTPEDFLDREGFFRMGRAPIMVEILPAIKGVEFDHAWERRVETVIDPETGLAAFVIRAMT
ncbi:MAG TPA: hypothetical protein VGG72_33505 [Bryobacteraceae bacterium]|jgi:hypothetical protein